MTTTVPDVRARDRIIEAVCAHYDTTRNQLAWRSAFRRPEYNTQMFEARMMLCVLLRRHTRYSMMEVARLIGYMTHTAVDGRIRRFKSLPADEQERLLRQFAGLEAVR